MDVMTSDNLAPRCPLCRAPLNENELIKVPEKRKQKPEAKKTGEEAEESKNSSKVWDFRQKYFLEATSNVRFHFFLRLFFSTEAPF